MSPRGQTLRFLQAFLSNPMGIGAVLPSSPRLARDIVDGIDLAPGEILLELGPGTGAVTAEIQHLLPQPQAYLGIEREPRFVDILERRFPDLRFLAGGAEQARELCAAQGVSQVNAIVSGLPFGALGNEEQDRILDEVEELLVPGGEFRTFGYVHTWPLPTSVRMRREVRRRLGPPRITTSMTNNVPPAWVLAWKR